MPFRRESHWRHPRTSAPCRHSPHACLGPHRPAHSKYCRRNFASRCREVRVVLFRRAVWREREILVALPVVPAWQHAERWVSARLGRLAGQLLKTPRRIRVGLLRLDNCRQEARETGTYLTRLSNLPRPGSYPCSSSAPQHPASACLLRNEQPRRCWGQFEGLEPRARLPPQVPEAAWKFVEQRLDSPAGKPARKPVRIKMQFCGAIWGATSSPIRFRRAPFAI
jgi:hypothetical protein